MFGSGNMKLENQQNGFVVVEQTEDKVVFYDPILEEQMIELGVVIPPSYQEKYGGRERVKLGEGQFFEAFQEFYSVYVFDPSVYQWKSVDK